jgi:hypothetical protein
LTMIVKIVVSASSAPTVQRGEPTVADYEP